MDGFREGEREWRRKGHESIFLLAVPVTSSQDLKLSLVTGHCSMKLLSTPHTLPFVYPISVPRIFCIQVTFPTSPVVGHCRRRS